MLFKPLRPQSRYSKLLQLEAFVAFLKSLQSEVENFRI